ncbi:MAG: YggS family pyridoxal phosphate-dependent enzyme [Lachnospiraceae bacterium]|nr:YggS family pyridoxal phosphate-dependent enzyme [Lachnospiraceae bacterium]
MISENIKSVSERIQEACKKSGRNPEEVTLISVSKTKPLEMLKEAYAAGSRDFGENKVQELCDKIPEMPEDVRWHMIGHLQTNKIKYIIGRTALIHSVDTLHLAEAIEKEAAKREITADILVEVNVAGEDSKFGTSDMEANKELIRSISELQHLRLCGLMTIAPYTDDPETNRPYFRTLRELLYSDEMRGFFPERPVLSMGMSGDYEIAVEEGATHVRVGTGIFGERDYSVK